MAKKILAILEQRDGKLKRFAFEAASTAVKIASKLNLDIEALTVGNEIENIAETGNYGIKKVTHLKNDKLANYSSSGYAEVIANYAKEIDSDYLLLASTALGKDLAPFLAAKLNAGLIMDVVNIDTSSGEITATRPVYAGKALIDVKFKSQKKVLTIRPNVFKAVSENGGSPEINVKEINPSNLKSKVVDFKKSEVNSM